LRGLASTNDACTSRLFQQAEHLGSKPGGQTLVMFRMVFYVSVSPSVPLTELIDLKAIQANFARDMLPLQARFECGVDTGMELCPSS
jgi:hypothetical protein